MTDPFFNITQRSVPTRNDRCDLPILYRDASWFGLYYRVPVERARELIGHEAIEPWPIFGAAVAAIYVWEYRDTSVGSYREFGLGIQARRKSRSPSLLGLVRDMGAQDDQGIWVLNLPVTTEAAHDAGVSLWGYPKYVAPIETSFERDRARVKLGDELTVTLPSLGGPRLSAQPVTTYTAKGGRLIRTVVRVDHAVRWGAGRGARVELLGDGPTARNIRALGLDRAKPVAAARADAFRAILPEGVELP